MIVYVKQLCLNPEEMSMGSTLKNAFASLRAMRVYSTP